MTKTIVNIEVVDAEKRRVPSKHYVYVIVVKWSDNSSLVVFRRYSRFFDLQTQLLDKFPIEAGATDPSLRIIPFLPGKIFFGRSQVRDVAMKRLGEIDAYCKSLLKLPKHISECSEVLEFFEVEPEDLDPPKSDPKERRFSLSLIGSKNKSEKKAEKISGPKRLEQFMAVADYDAQEKGEMNLQAGMTVEVAEKSESGWWFVNAEDQQGWVPSTYLQPMNGSAVNQDSAVDGQDEKYICIETFTATNADEISLGKGVVVEVQQKHMDGWWNVKYQGQEGYAPATYLKKCTDPYAKSLVEKSRQSGVQIIGNLSDVSTLLTSSSSPRNSGIFVSNTAHNATSAVSSTDHSNGVSGAASQESEEQTEESDDEWTKVETDVVDDTGPDPRKKALANVMMKQRSLERGGSLKPPPRQNSVKQMVVSPPPTPTKTSTYVTIADFEDTVGDGISFETGESVTVLEKTSSGWWFVKRGEDEGWVPESFLEQSSAPTSSAAGNITREEDIDEDEEEDSEDEEKGQSPSSALSSALNSRFQGLNKDSKSTAPALPGAPKLPGKATSRPPALPVKPKNQSQPTSMQEDSNDTTSAASQEEPASGIASALKSKFEAKPPNLPSKPAGKPAPLGLPTKPALKPGLPSKTFEKPAPPGLPNKPADKPKPPGLPAKPAEKPGLPSLPKKPDQQEGDSAPGNVAGLAKSLKSKFESQQQDDKPSKPPTKPVFQGSKPSLPSKSFGNSQNKPSLPNKPSGDARPSTPQKPVFPNKNIASGDSVRPPFPPSKASSGPPKLPSKPQVGSKPSSDSNNNSRDNERPSSSKVHGMAAAFSKSDTGPKPMLPGKKPTLPQPPAQKPSFKTSTPEATPGKPRVGNLVSELGSKLQFGGGDGGAHKGPESSPVSKAGPWSTKPKEASESSSVGKVSPWSAQQQNNTQSSFPAPQTAAQSGGAQYEVVADFDGESKTELSVRCGDIVEVISQDQDDWWLVRLNNEEGWVPTSYLEPAPEWDD